MLEYVAVVLRSAAESTGGQRRRHEKERGDGSMNRKEATAVWTGGRVGGWGAGILMVALIVLDS